MVRDVGLIRARSAFLGLSSTPKSAVSLAKSKVLTQFPTLDSKSNNYRKCLPGPGASAGCVHSHDGCVRQDPAGGEEPNTAQPRRGPRLRKPNSRARP